MTEAATASPSARQFLRTLSLVALAIAVLFAVDTFLGKMEESEDRMGAQRLYRESQQLLSQNHAAEAAGRLKDALAIERGNRDYQLALAQAQLAAHEFDDAEKTLRDLLLADSTNGPANLAMARVLVKQGRIREAVSYYHRAIYGQWKNDSDGNRLTARFELIELLAQQNSKEELLAELLAVQDQAPDDIQTRLRIARLFLAAGSPPRAAVVFREVLKASKDERTGAEAYAGIGDADFARGDYRAAAGDYSSAVKLNPDDQAASKRLELCEQVLALDPTRRGLDSAERFRRSRKLLELTLEVSAPCFGSNPPAVAQDLAERGRKSLHEQVRAGRQDSAGEGDIELAEKLWQARKSACAPPAADDALALVLARAAQ